MSPSLPLVTVAPGDGIGPSLMEATLRILDAAGARLDIRTIELGEAVYRAGHASGIAPQSWDVLRDSHVLLKGPITTPQGGGYKSLNVSLRKALGLYANVRPCVAYHPVVPTRHPGMDVVIVRENEEDLYAGIEHRQTDEVVQCLKLITRPGCERIVRYAFEYARRHGRRRVTCFIKDNIMKMTDGLFHRVFEEIGAQYPELQRDSLIVDIGTARLADAPQDFDVIVTPNLYGDIVSDVAAQIAGSVGMAGSANIGEHCAMFEAIHGSAPQLAGRDVANPSGLLNAAVLMLLHLGQAEVAQRVHNAWLSTLEEGLHTADIFREGHSRQRLGTQAFALAVVQRLGREPQILRPARFDAQGPLQLPAPARRAPARKQLVGVDVFLHWSGSSPEPLAQALRRLTPGLLGLQLITNRGVKVWPHGLPQTFCVDHWRCRFKAANDGLRFDEVLDLQARLHQAGYEVIKTENLYHFDGEPGYAGVHG
ncbi:MULTISPECIES: NADP-dependent isocitrate dehydrogenase [Caldimonas]|uniref:NADP-dependent isocitrate dehydrogenase n=1 Tax=Caldimonas TaxID=196013 RepID=UPI00047643B8|nr:NADP-dependent isocitrate dehydrogenase [Caldimonas manganoxidans]